MSYPDPAVYDTLPKLLRYNVDHHGSDIAVREKDLGIWHECTWAEYGAKVKHIALAIRDLGVTRGDVVAMIGDNDSDWTAFEIAAHTAGAMTMGIYRDALEEEVGYLAEYAEVALVYAENQEQVDKFLALGDRLPTLKHIVYADDRGMRKRSDPRLVHLETLIAAGTEADRKAPGAFDQMVTATKAEDVAILCTTSGTTSNPKLAMLPHGRFVRHIHTYLAADPKGPHDEYVSVLPLPWIMEQVYVFGFGLVSRMKVNFPESEETSFADLREIGPTFLLLAPRVLEQIAADMRARMMDASSLNQWLFDKGLKIAVDAVEHGRHSTLANMMVMGALRDRLGFGNVTSAATGGAAMGPDTFKLFLAMGVPLKQLYGQTETLGAYTLQDGKELDVDTVGIPFEGCEVKIENPDPEGVGEIVTRHPNMFTGYYNNPEATASDLRDGWMHTGDAGYFDAKGRLTVIDRVKDMAETSTGVKFSPQYIENKLKFSPYVGEAVILGSGHPYLTAIICVRFSTVSKWAEKNRVGFTSYTGLSADERIYELIRGEVEHVNAGLPEHQRIRRFLLLYKELDADDGELTRTRKVRRGVVSERYGQLIDALYGDAGTARLDTEVMFEDGRRTRVQADMTIMEVGGDAPSGDLRKAG
ncbi:AMP-binding protein [Thalassobaculum salexigens]|uniref:AMP-binding protein n=1 Tax=Thalassobaculum salexigens TaxID=455360 RepID=UPI0004076272|nr:AMP-binding protein [Thalassobaculum salexigens]